MSYTFKWSVLWSGQSGHWLLQGLVTTLELSALAWILAVALGILSGALRTVPFRPLRWAATFYVEFFRNVPLLVWMFFWYFAVPPLLPRPAQDWVFNHGAEFWAATIALGVYHGARMSEVIRSGIGAIPRTQFEASVAIGLTTFQAYRLVILPVALRLIVPPGTNESLNLLKNSSVALTDAPDRDVHRQGDRGADRRHAHLSGAVRVDRHGHGAGRTALRDPWSHRARGPGGVAGR